MLYLTEQLQKVVRMSVQIPVQQCPVLSVHMHVLWTQTLTVNRYFVHHPSDFLKIKIEIYQHVTYAHRYEMALI